MKKEKYVFPTELGAVNVQKYQASFTLTGEISVLKVEFAGETKEYQQKPPVVSVLKVFCKKTHPHTRFVLIVLEVLLKNKKTKKIKLEFSPFLKI